MPQHIWSKVSDPAKFTEPEPGRLGTVHAGHALQLAGLRPLEEPELLARRASPKIQCVERSPRASNDAALLQQVNGDADWSHNFYPNVEVTYQAKDPAHYHNSYLTTALPVALFFDLTKYPYSLVGFRKGVSQAIDRKTVSKLGEYGYAPPT